MPTEFVYKIVSLDTWRTANTTGAFVGSSDDMRDGYIHLSTAEQVDGTLKKYFNGQEGLALICFRSDDLAAHLRWEPSRGGALFPHYYGTLPTSLAVSEKPLPLGASGDHQLPDLIR